MLEAACHSEARWPSVAIGLLLYWVAAEPRLGRLASRYNQSHGMGIDLVFLVISRWGERAGRGNSAILCSRGRLAQRLAQVLYTHKAGGSNPSSPTKECEREGRVALAFLFIVCGFEPRPGCGAEEAAG